jgi:lysophosphatidate acyltransferase
VLTNDIKDDSASIEKLSLRVRENMLTALRDISPTSKDE